MTGVTQGIANRRVFKLSKPHKPVKWSHQAELDSLKGRKIGLRLAHMDDTDCLIVTLIEADQFAIKVQTDGFMLGKQSIMTYFKHQIAAFAAA